MVLLVPLHAALWTWDVVAFHAVVGVLYAAFTVELFFHTLLKVPFTAVYISGSIRLKTRWWVYFCGAWMLTSVPAFFEARALRFGSGGVFLPLGLLLLACGLAIGRQRREKDAPGLVFDDSSDEIPQALGLSRQ